MFFSQLEAQVEENTAEAQKERKLRERTEQYSKQLEEELDGMKVMHSSYSSYRNTQLRKKTFQNYFHFFLLYYLHVCVKVKLVLFHSLNY